MIHTCTCCCISRQLENTAEFPPTKQSIVKKDPRGDRKLLKCTKLTSQYFLRHSDRLHLQPAVCPELFWSKIALFFAIASFKTLSRRVSNLLLLWQSWQLHPSQRSLLEKHSQYIFKHFVFLQLHVVRFAGDNADSLAAGFSFPVTWLDRPFGPFCFASRDVDDR